MIWLASGSPRRRTLLEWAGFRFEVHPPDVDETRDSRLSPEEHARSLARRKADTAPATEIVLAADTVVHRGDRIFDKPRDRAEAARHLADLSGGWHKVTTGVSVGRGPDRHTLSVTTDVRFRALSPTLIDDYVASGDGDDKAGAYGIQGRGAVLVAEVRGSWTNVVGLPLEAVVDALRALGEEPFHGHR